MYYVYLLKSQKYEQTYVGFTSDLQRRLTAHNTGKSLHTSKFKPWTIVTYTAFASESKVRDFENISNRALVSHSQGNILDRQ